MQNTSLTEQDVARYNELWQKVGLDYDGLSWNAETVEMAGLEERAKQQGSKFVLRQGGIYALEQQS